MWLFGGNNEKHTDKLGDDNKKHTDKLGDNHEKVTNLLGGDNEKHTDNIEFDKLINYIQHNQNELSGSPTVIITRCNCLPLSFEKFIILIFTRFKELKFIFKFEFLTETGYYCSYVVDCSYFAPFVSVNLQSSKVRMECLYGKDFNYFLEEDKKFYKHLVDEFGFDPIYKNRALLSLFKNYSTLHHPWLNEFNNSRIKKLFELFVGTFDNLAKTLHPSLGCTDDLNVFEEFPWFLHEDKIVEIALNFEGKLEYNDMAEIIRKTKETKKIVISYWGNIIDFYCYQANIQKCKIDYTLSGKEITVSLVLHIKLFQNNDIEQWIAF